ncbi:hypothetical protein C7374_11144 [Falsochrobactrum ovis]|uniref:Uncharacterized protein n=1 Tax=Falsochrobactrum ovis TaxID=1293442 RepID=A0A364JTJ0_9HYPH|nr:hypothetical protein C7374_11144 [Falsochrobactrum ovis]
MTVARTITVNLCGLIRSIDVLCTLFARVRLPTRVRAIRVSESANGKKQTSFRKLIDNFCHLGNHRMGILPTLWIQVGSFC